MILDKKILDFMGKKNFAPMNIADLKKALKLNLKDSRQLSKSLLTLTENGEIVKIKKDRYCLPEDANLVAGTILFKANGKATLMPKANHFTPISIRAENTGVALHGDFVLVRLDSSERSNARRITNEQTLLSGKVIQVLKSVNEIITGTLRKTRNIYFVIPDNPKIILDILVEPPTDKKLEKHCKENSKVVVKLLKWTNRHINPVGEIIECLGDTHTPDAEFLAILRKNKLSDHFPKKILDEVKKVPKEVRKSDIKGRLDCRELFTINIDPDDAQDFDDALTLEELENGQFRVGIHIADVSAYVTPGSPIDEEAKKRGNSTYLVGVVIPMLPKELSNGICSLVESEDRLTKSVFLTFDHNKKIIETHFANTVICNNKRLTYHQAYAFLKEKDLTIIRKTVLPAAHQTGSIGRKLSEVKDPEMKLIQKMIHHLWDIALTVRKRRMKKGSLDFDMSEVKIYVNEEGYADRIESLKDDESHQLIEEFMLAANDSVAKALHEVNLPYISRVHDEPDPKKLDELSQFLTTFNYISGDLTQRKNIIKFLEKIKKDSQSYTLKIQFLRSLKQACYRAEADGHYGLNKIYYAHFTSPIRRYSDLIVHRMFNYYLYKQNNPTALGTPKSPYNKTALTSLAEHLSITEQNSVLAERDHKKIKLLEFFSRELQKKQKTPFEAIITELKNHGLFIELTESSAFGFIHVSSLRDDMYYLNPEGTALQGKRKKQLFKIGQKIFVQVEKVDFYKKQMDFSVIRNSKRP